MFNVTGIKIKTPIRMQENNNPLPRRNPPPLASIKPLNIEGISRAEDYMSIYGVAWSPKLNLHVGIFRDNYGFGYSTTNGETWTRATANIGYYGWGIVEWVPYLEAFVALTVEGSHRSAISVDGINWTISSLSSSAWKMMAFSGSKIFVGADAMSGNYQAMSSSNGVSFSPYSLGSTGGCTWIESKSLFYGVFNRYTYINSEEVVIAELRTSTDGANWTTVQRLPTNIYFSGIIWVEENEMFYGYGYDGVRTSPDGINWTLTSETSSIYHMIYIEEHKQFIATTYDNIIRNSTDFGETWSTFAANSMYRFEHIVYSAENNSLVITYGLSNSNRGVVIINEVE